MSATQQATSADQELVQSIFDRIGADLGMIIDRSVHVNECQADGTIDDHPQIVPST